MDLMIFIVIFMSGLLIYYLIDTVRLLQKEIREIKDKCITTNNSKQSDFNVNTTDPLITIPDNTIKMLYNLKELFN